MTLLVIHVSVMSESVFRDTENQMRYVTVTDMYIVVGIVDDVWLLSRRFPSGSTRNPMYP